MGFLNIMGGIAAGAQRADELKAKKAASKTKGETVADKLVGEIIKKRWCIWWGMGIRLREETP